MNVLARLSLASLVLSLSLAAPRPARAGGTESACKEADVPKVVVEALAKKYPGSVVKSWAKEEEDKKVAYEAKVEIASKDKDGKEIFRKIDAVLSDDGKVLYEEELVVADALPAAVRIAIAASKYAKATVKSIERTILAEKADAATYEIAFELDGKKHEATFDATGKITEEEEADEADEKDDDGKDKKGEGHEGMNDAKPETPKTEPGMK